MIRFLLRAFLVLLLAVLVVAGGFRLAAMLRETGTIASLQPETGRMVETATGRIFLQEAGPVDGQPLLLVHGTGAWSGLWAETMQALGNQGYRTIAFDLPPFGFSDRDPGGDYSRSAQAGRILALVEALGVQPILVAHSFGAAPAAEAVMRDQGAFAGFVMIDGAVGLGSHENADKSLPLLLRIGPVRQVVISMTATNPMLTKLLLAQLLHVKEAARPVYVDVLQQPMGLKGSTAAFSDWLPSLLIPPREAQSTRAEGYRGLSLPTRLIWGDMDTVTPLAQGEALATLIGQGPVRVLPGIGHIPQIEAPQAFQTLLGEVLAEISAL